MSCGPSEVNQADSSTFVFHIATVFEKPQKKLDIKDITFSDLASLKKSDPFMYYSIPAIRKAVLYGKEVDSSEISMPISDQIQRTMRGRSSKNQVTRQSRISFECYTDLLLEDLTDNFNSVCLDHNEQKNESMDQNDFFKQLFSCDTKLWLHLCGSSASGVLIIFPMKFILVKLARILF